MQRTLYLAVAICAALSAGACDRNPDEMDSPDVGTENTDIIGAPGGAGSASGSEIKHLGGHVGKGTGYGTMADLDGGGASTSREAGAPAPQPSGLRAIPPRAPGRRGGGSRPPPRRRPPPPRARRR